MADETTTCKRDKKDQAVKRREKEGAGMELKNLLTEIEDKLLEAMQRRFTGEIRLTFNVSQGGFSTSYIESERENLVRKRDSRKMK